MILNMVLRFCFFTDISEDEREALIKCEKYRSIAQKFQEQRKSFI